LEDFLGWVTANQRLFEGKEDPLHSPYTYLGRWLDGQYIAVFTHEAKAQLTRMGYSPEAILRSWRDRGWLKAQSDRLTYRLRVRGVLQYLITLEWTAVESAGVSAKVAVA
jgi:hypothetical protein